MQKPPIGGFISFTTTRSGDLAELGTVTPTTADPKKRTPHDALSYKTKTNKFLLQNQFSSGQ